MWIFTLLVFEGGAQAPWPPPWIRLWLTTRTQHLTRNITPPQPLPTEWNYKPPPIFIQPTIKLSIALTLQKVLEHGLNFQTPQRSTPTPFLTPFEECLTLQENLPPLTHFNLRPYEKRTHEKYNKLLTNLKEELKTKHLAIVAADKGPGLILIQNKTLATIYEEYLNKTGNLITATQYIHCIRKLKDALLEIEDHTNLQNTDDRTPTMYFKNPQALLYHRNNTIYRDLHLHNWTKRTYENTTTHCKSPKFHNHMHKQLPEATYNAYY